MAYENMKNDVRDAVPKLIAVKVIPVRMEVTVKATKRMKQGALKALDAIEELFGPKGKYWVKGNYHTAEQGFDAFCLSGAFNKVDGRHEALARAAISVAIAELFPSRTDKLWEPEDWSPEAVAEEDTITSFNDSNYTKWSDVRKVMKRARQILSA